MKKLAILLNTVVLIITIIIALGIANIDSIAKKAVESNGSKIFKVPITLSSAKISIFLGSGSLNNLTIKNPKVFF